MVATTVEPKPKRAAKPVRAKPQPAPAADPHRAKMAAASRDKSASRREVGKPHPPTDPARRERCRRSFRAFCESYLPEWFPLAWSRDHLRAVKKIEDAVLRGGRFAFAMPRGSGKTTLCEAAVLWAVLNGHRRFVVLIGAEAESAKELLAEIMEQLETSDLIDDDFNEVTRYIRALEGIAQRANGQTADGERTRIEWTDKLMRLPTVPGSVASAAVVKVAGITGRIRGMKVRGQRPDLVILDDPETDESARSLTQNEARERVLAGAVLGLAGPKRSIAAFMPCTVIAPSDMADRILDPARHPKWQGERMKMLYALPTAEGLWKEYGRLQATGFAAGDKGKVATAYYRANRKAMDAGAEVAWPQRFPDGTVSAVQHAMDLLIDNRRSFMAEYQNEPEADEETTGRGGPEADAVVKKVTNLPRGTVPRGGTRLVAMIDVGAHLLWYLVCAFDERFGGSVIDYGPYPDQSRAHFAATDPRPGMGDLPGMAGVSQDAAIYAGLTAVAARILGTGYRREETGDELRVERCLVDANWGPGTDLVYEFCRRDAHAAVLLPSHGRFVGASSNPMASWPVRPGERAGPGWRVSPVSTARGRHVTFDANAWKSFAAARLATPAGAAGCLSLYAPDARGHQLAADHFAAEYPVEVAAKGRKVDEWKTRPNRDNHLWDCLVGCVVAAGERGLRWTAAAAAGVRAPAPPPAKAMSFSAMQKAAREKRAGAGGRR